MPRVIVTEGARVGLEKCRKFLKELNPSAAQRASQEIRKAFKQLGVTPQMGRPDDDHPELREILIPFGSSGYVALYRLDSSLDSVFILAFRHQKEAGYE